VSSRRLARAGLLAVVVLLGMATVLGLLDGLSPYFELATFFRPQYAILLGIAALAAVVLRRFRVAVTAAVLALVNVVVISQVPLAASSGDAPAPQLRMLLVNLEYGNTEHERVSRLVGEVDPDVIGFTELTPAWVDGLEEALEPYPNRVLAPEEGAYGVGLYTRLPLSDARIEHVPREGPPSAVGVVAVDRRSLDVVVTHVHTPFAGPIHGRQFDALADRRAGLGDRLAICGDFNAVPWSEPVRELSEQAELGSLHGRYGSDGSWPSNSLFRLPIDNCLVSDGVAVVDASVGGDIGSDHLPLIVDLALVAPS
jgi:endonuclease/exonuclease/phosphatase (EEP) superfamily protein YafD